MAGSLHHFFNKDYKMIKDMKRGTANCDVLGEDASAATHVKRVTPLDTKRKEVEGDPQYAAVNKAREKSTTAKRRNKDTRPL
jgi:hypothetical protein